MNNNKIAHIISHSHWDREWYLPYGKHHVKLVELMDTLLEVLDRDPEFKSFHMDGQTIMFDDYLQVRPEMKEKLVRYVKEGRLFIGPWYILQDAFLTSSEANVRNLLVGHQDATHFGSVTPIGYFPDTFGNIGQAPQLLSQAGIETAVFGRGINPIGANNTVGDESESPYSEMIWKSPDGSQVMGILFANWYHNGMEIPVDEEEAKAYWPQKLADVEKFASTPHLLFMNGCDHQPVQVDLSEALDTARKLYPDIEFVHSNFTDYALQVKNSLPADVSIIQGELRSEHTDGWTTLVNTASTRVYLKQANQVSQSMLEKVAEPLATIAYQLGKPYPHHLFTYAWKKLMQNHPHDSICGCSVDEVHQGMITRFQKSKHVAEEITAASIEHIGAQINTDAFKKWSENAIPLVVYNSTGWERTGVVSVDVELDRLPLYTPSPEEIARQLEQINVAGRLVDHLGNEIPCDIVDLGVSFDYDLPKDRFRQPYMKRAIRLTFEAKSLPVLGYRTYAWLPDGENEASAKRESLVTGERKMENESLAVTINQDGTLEVHDKVSGRTFSNLGAYEEVGDIGNEYMFKQPEGEVTRTTNGLNAQIRLLQDSPLLAKFEIVHEWEVPECADDLLQLEQNRLVNFKDRQAKRSNKMIPFVITTNVSLEKDAHAVRIRTTVNNQAKDHRLRVLFPTDLQADTHKADSIFEIAERMTEPSAKWENPSHCQHQQAFVSVDDGDVGLTIANKGLNEYEVLRDGRHTIAVTLLRSVGELGDWGYFPTPEAQCLGEHTLEYAIIPHKGNSIDANAVVEAYQYQVPWTVGQAKLQEGSLPLEGSFLAWSGEGLAFSTMKVSEKSGDIIARWFNMKRENTKLSLAKTSVPTQWSKSNIMEDNNEQIVSWHDDSIEVEVKPAEIITLSGKVD